MKSIKYVGNKDLQKDILYGSNTRWDGNGDIQAVDDDLAEKLLKHPDCYEIATDNDMAEFNAANEVTDETGDEEAAALLAEEAAKKKTADEEKDKAEAEAKEAAEKEAKKAAELEAKEATEKTEALTKNEAAVKSPASSETPSDPQSRIDQIIAAINGLDEGDTALWSVNTGMPHVKVIEKALGFNISADERDQACAAIDAADQK